MPNALGDPANYIPANPLQTPPEIVPEWYLLPFYAILRSVPDIWLLVFTIPSKTAGVLCMFGSIGVLFILPWLDTSPVRSSRFRPVYKWFFWLLAIDMFALGAVGAHRPDAVVAGISYLSIGRLGTLYYFFHFLILLPLLGKLERPRPLPASISAAVLKPARAPASGKMEHA